MALWESRRLQKASSVFPASQKDKPGTPSNVPLPTASFFGGASFGDLRSKKRGRRVFFVLRAYGCRSTCWSRKRRIFRRLEFLFVCFFEKKKRPKPNVEINATFPRIPNPQPDVFPPIKPPPPYTTSHHQHPPTPHLQYPSVSFSPTRPSILRPQGTGARGAARAVQGHRQSREGCH